MSASLGVLSTHLAQGSCHVGQVPPMTAEKTRAILEEELGQRLDLIFEWIDMDKPLGSATISQVRTMATK